VWILAVAEALIEQATWFGQASGPLPASRFKRNFGEGFSEGRKKSNQEAKL
jgi:hypothetical protein